MIFLFFLLSSLLQNCFKIFATAFGYFIQWINQFCICLQIVCWKNIWGRGGGNTLKEDTTSYNVLCPYSGWSFLMYHEAWKICLKGYTETDVSFSTQGGLCRLYNEDAVIDLRDLSRRRNVKHIWNMRVIYRFRSNNRGGILSRDSFGSCKR